MRRLLDRALMTLSVLLLAVTVVAPAKAERQADPMRIVLTADFIVQRCAYLSVRDCALARFTDSVIEASRTSTMTSVTSPFEVYALRNGYVLLGAGTVRVDASVMKPGTFNFAQTVAAATLWTYTYTDFRFELYNTMAQDVIRAPQRANTFIAAVHGFDAELARVLDPLRKSLDAARLESRELSREVGELESRAKLATGGLSPQACQPSAALQNQWLDLKGEAAREVAVLQNEVANMRARLASCKTAADAEALRLAWARAAQGGDQVTASMASAVNLRQRMLENMAVAGGRRTAAVGMVAAQLATLRSGRVDALSRQLAAVNLNQAVQIPLSLREGAELVPKDLRSLANPFRNSAQAAWQREVWSAAIEAALRQAAIAAGQQRDAIARAVDGRAAVDQIEMDRDVARSAVVDLNRRLDALPGQLTGAACGAAFDVKMDDFDRAQRNARVALDESDRIFSVSDRCVTGTAPTVPPPTERPDQPTTPQRPVTQTVPTTPRVFAAELVCPGRLDLVSGGRPELCGVKVTGWNSATTEPVRITIDPPFTAVSGLRAFPGNTSQAGDTMYAAGVNDRYNEYVFSEGFGAALGAPTGNTTIAIIVSQGDSEVRLPLTLGVRGDRTPTDITFEKPTPNVSGSGGPYCVWQYKLFGDPIGCWHLAAAGCTEVRYTQPEYVMVGNNMSRSQADKRVGDLSRYFNDGACKANPYDPMNPNPPRNVNTNPPNPNGTPRNLEAELECGGQLEIVSGGRVETCGVKVTGWRSDTTTPVEIIFDPRFSPASGVRVAPGDTRQSGDTMYSAGVSDRFAETFFAEAFSAERGAPTSSTPLEVIVRQGNAEVRLPLTVNVVSQGTPKGSSFEPPTPNITGSGGPYCVWQFKTFIDVPGCWNGVAAGCTEPRYAGRPEYVLIGNSMTRSEADRRIGEISQFFDRATCTEDGREKARKAKEEEEARRQKAREEEEARRKTEEAEEEARRKKAEAEEEARRKAEEKERERPVSRYSRFGIAPRDTTIKVGESIRFQAFGTILGARDMVTTVDDVKWSGDRPNPFTATAADAGRTFAITATGPAGETDTVVVTVAPATTVTGPGGPGGPGGPAPPGTLQVMKVTTSNDTQGRYGSIKYTETSVERRDEEGPNNVQDYRCSFGGVPQSLAPGQVYPISAQASAVSNPPTWHVFFEAVVNVGGGIEYVGAQTPAYGTNNPKPPRPPGAGSFAVRLREGATSGVITLSCYPGGTVASYQYGVK